MTKTPRGRAAPPAATPTPPRTLPELVAWLEQELQEVEQDIAYHDAELRGKRERAAYLRGRLESYASITLVDANPATLEHDQEAG